jgi:hypothetical protein
MKRRGRTPAATASAHDQRLSYELDLVMRGIDFHRTAIRFFFLIVLTYFFVRGEVASGDDAGLLSALKTLAAAVFFIILFRHIRARDQLIRSRDRVIDRMHFVNKQDMLAEQSTGIFKYWWYAASTKWWWVLFAVSVALVVYSIAERSAWGDAAGASERVEAAR